MTFTIPETPKVRQILLSYSRFVWNSSSIHQKFFFDPTGGFLWFYWNAEPSTLSRRAFAIATPSLRRFDDEPSATSWIQRSASVGVWKKVKENKEMKGSPLQLPQGGGKNVKREVWSLKRSHPDGKANGKNRDKGRKTKDEGTIE